MNTNEDVTLSRQQESCKQCGQCCVNGGAALHGPDLGLIQSGRIPQSNLITLRKGEMAHNPVVGKVQPLEQELVKLKGTGKQWNCCYFDIGSTGCSLYEHRPLACRVLQCWDPEKILDMVNRDTLTRRDIIGEDDPLWPLIVEHDGTFPCPDFLSLPDLAAGEPNVSKQDLQNIVNGDLRFRDKVSKEHSLKVSDELFYFGRPLFQLLQPFGIRVSESPFGLELHWPREIKLP
ncbi:YkgJ family cysteine cluster protein [Desulfopila sp. IMCC35008]|uniref:YkgJ family cysteine cluster protein n=1 Tax=Desulfopila sp. IMCC35008 TaxID=2653858 RepID=UPI0013D73417|nr:YkgJ family cysteine cluster protein [Desulfopila sp. IMCC35008]